MWNPPSEYKSKQNWLPHEDKTLISAWGLTTLEEICECFMCHPFNVVSRARQLGIMPAEFTYLTAQHLEWMTRLYEDGHDDSLVADKFGLPDHNLKYIQPRSDAITQARREVQDFYSKLNKDQIDLFGEPSA
jgi:hypothetical protein